MDSVSFICLLLIFCCSLATNSLSSEECFDDRQGPKDCHTLSDTCHHCSCHSELQPGQFYCLDPDIDEATQAERGCHSNGTVLVQCFAAPNVTCCGQTYNASQCLFQQERNCRYVTGQQYDYYVAVTLSLFLGMLGIDRFYLGYPAIGLMKLCTFGFFLIGHLIDFLLILIQVVGPADRSGYYAPFYGPLVSRVNTTDPFLPAAEGVTP